jgi:hypothetical protein
MRSFWHDPLSTWCDAAQSAIGWLLVVFGTSILGLWLGLWIGFGELPSIHWITCGPMILLLAPLVCPQLFVLYGYTLLLWYLPDRCESFDSTELRLAGAVVNLLLWLGFGAMVGSAFS